MNFFKVFWLIFFICNSGLSASESNHRRFRRMVNGVPAKIESFPWYVFIDGRCGGSLIDKRWVVTAAHCLEKLTKQNPTLVYFGLDRLPLYTLPDGFQIVDQKALNHKIRQGLVLVRQVVEQFQPKTILDSETGLQSLGDIALLWLNESVPLNTDRIKTIRLNQNRKAVLGHLAKLAGFGRSGLHLSIQPLLQGTFLIDPKCSAWEENITDMICAVSINLYQQTCNGDSGSGLVVGMGNHNNHDEDGNFVNEPLLVGLDSRGLCEPGLGDFYTDIAYYYQWITDTIRLKNFLQPFRQCKFLPGFGVKYCTNHFTNEIDSVWKFFGKKSTQLNEIIDGSES